MFLAIMGLLAFFVLLSVKLSRRHIASSRFESTQQEVSAPPLVDPVLSLPWWSRKEPHEMPWNQTAVFIIDVYDSTLEEEVVRMNAFIDFARSKGATIFQLCFQCYIPFDNRTGWEDVLIRQSFELGQGCSISPVQGEGIFLSSDQRVHVRRWPFRQPPPKGPESLQDACALMAHDLLEFKYKFGRDCGDFWPTKSYSENSVRTDDTLPFVMHPSLSVDPMDVYTQDEDIAWRVLTYRNISHLMVMGVDANECVLYARYLSILTMLSRGWPASNIFAVPQASSTKYDVQGVMVDWLSAGAHLWSAALEQNFSVRSLCAPAIHVDAGNIPKKKGHLYLC